MRLLLDTHIFLWWVAGSRRLRGRVHETIAEAEAAFVSAVTAAEVGIKVSVGKLTFDNVIRVSIEDAGFQALPFTVDHAEHLGALPLHHRDPFDRMLIAQARVEGLTIVTADSQFRAYDVPTVLL